jgi:tetratricopeptide (TPR) repeat protein
LGIVSLLAFLISLAGFFMRIFYFILLLLTVVFTQKLSAQKRLVDSLLVVLKQHPAQDDKHLKALNELAAAQFWMINAESIASADKAIALATKLNNREELAKAYNNKAIALGTNDIDEAYAMAQKALANSTGLNSKEQLFDSYINLASICYNQGKIEDNSQYSQKALEVAKQVNNPLLQGKLFMSMGSFYRNNNQDSALFYFKKAHKFFEKAGHEDFTAFNMLFIGNTFNLYSVNDSAIIYLNRSLAIARKTGSLCNLANGYGALGILYMSIADYQKSLNCFINGLKVAETVRDKFVQALSCLNIGYIYCQLGKYKEAKDYCNRGLAFAKEVNNPEMIYSSYEAIGDVYFAEKDYSIATMHGHVGNAYQMLNQYAMALNSFSKAMALNQKSKNNFLLTRNYISVGTAIKNAPAPVLMEAGINPQMRYKLAIEYFQKALLLNKESGELEVQRDALFELSVLYDNQHEFANALQYYKQYVAIKDSMINTENSKNIANIQLQFDSEKQQQQIVLLNKDKALHSTEIQNQKTQRNVIVGGFALLIILIGFIANAYFAKNRSNKKIEETFAHLQKTQQQLVEQGKLAALGQMTAEVALRIKEPISKIKELSPKGELLIKQFENATTDEESTVMLQKIKMYLSEIRNNGLKANDVVKDVLIQTRKQNG